MISLPYTTAILTDLNKGWLTIRFNKPENRNALSEDLTSELVDVLNTVRDDRSIRGITLRGNGGIFCAGGDLKAFNLLVEGGTRNDIITMNSKGGDMFALINTMPQVVLVLVEGAAIAGGLGMVCCADIIAATKDAKFSLTETQLGIVPAQIAPYIVQRMGLNRARRLMLTGARFTGVEAEIYGLVDYVVDNAEGLDGIQEQIHKSVNRCAPGANAATKKLVLSAPYSEPTVMRDIAAEAFTDCMMSDEGREGIISFVSKRKPNWASEGE